MALTKEEIKESQTSLIKHEFALDVYQLMQNFVSKEVGLNGTKLSKKDKIEVLASIVYKSISNLTEK